MKFSKYLKLYPTSLLKNVHWDSAILPLGQALGHLWAWQAPQLFPEAEALLRGRQQLLLPSHQNLDSAPSSLFPPSQQQFAGRQPRLSMNFQFFSFSILCRKHFEANWSSMTLKPSCWQTWCWLLAARRDWVSVVGGLLWWGDGRRTRNRRQAGVSSVGGVRLPGRWWCRRDWKQQFPPPSCL